MRVRLDATLRDLAGQKELSVDACDGDSVRQVLRRVAGQCPALGKKLWDQDEQLTGQVTVLVNGRVLAFAGGLDRSLQASDDIKLFPPVGGG